jgi:pimeloyl-ACP methyl ester carboxylesterase
MMLFRQLGVPTLIQEASIVRVRFIVTLLTACLAAVALTPPASAAAGQRFTTHSVPFGEFRLHVRDYRGAGPAIVLMHGFPDNLHLYDRLYRHLRGRRVIAFDFLGFGRSDKPRSHRYTFANRRRSSTPSSAGSASRA